MNNNEINLIIDGLYVARSLMREIGDNHDDHEIRLAADAISNALYLIKDNEKSLTKKPKR
jgi:hypothetical protein